jgi:hypothetical protein
VEIGEEEKQWCHDLQAALEQLLACERQASHKRVAVTYATKALDDANSAVVKAKSSLRILLDNKPRNP